MGFPVPSWWLDRNLAALSPRWRLRLGAVCSALVVLVGISQPPPPAPRFDMATVHLLSWGQPAQVSLLGVDLELRDGDGRTLLQGFGEIVVALEADGEGLQLVSNRGRQQVTAPLTAVSADDEVTVAVGNRSRRYPGTLIAWPEGASIRLANQAPVERYVAAVLAAETPASFPTEAHQAMAVAIRGYAVRRMVRGPHTGALCDTNHCQAYDGLERIAAVHSLAARETAGEIPLLGGAPIEAVYCADCGGWTAANEEAWPGQPPVLYLRAHADAPDADAPPFCAASPRHQWTLILSEADLRALASEAPPGELGIEVRERTESQRVARLRLGALEPGDSTRVVAAGAREFTGAALRARLGPTRLPSLRFSVTNSQGGALLDGSGAGHGVGLCQYGARGMAEAGLSYRRILTHYYPGVVVGSWSPAGGDSTAR